MQFAIYITHHDRNNLLQLQTSHAMHLKGSAEKVAFPTRLCASTAVKITPPPTTASQAKEKECQAMLISFSAKHLQQRGTHLLSVKIMPLNLIC